MSFVESTALRACLAAAALVAFGCTSPSFTPSGNFPNRPPKARGEVKTYFDADEPRCKYRVVGYYKSRNGIENIPEDVAARGFDGVLGMSCATPGTVGYDWAECTAKAYVCE